MFFGWAKPDLREEKRSYHGGAAVVTVLIGKHCSALRGAADIDAPGGISISSGRCSSASPHLNRRGAKLSVPGTEEAGWRHFTLRSAFMGCARKKITAALAERCGGKQTVACAWGEEQFTRSDSSAHRLDVALSVYAAAVFPQVRHILPLSKHYA